MAKRNYPLVKQLKLIEKSKDYSLDNANKGYLPQISIAGQVTYQSDVTGIPISLPNLTIEPLNKDQYRLYNEITQPISDLFILNKQKNLIDKNSEVEKQKIEVELFKLNERINNLFFGILLIEAQIKQTELLKKDIQTGIDKAIIAVDNGVALSTSVDLLKAELLKVNQRTIELKSNRMAYTKMLSIYIDSIIDENVILEKPMQQINSNTINRPEIKLFEIQKESLSIQNKLINNKNIPKFNLFIQSGLGRPALNMLSNEISGYYIGGLKLNWNLTSLYTSNKEKKILSLNQFGIDIQKETFILNTKLSIQQQSAETNKYIELLESDSNIIIIRENIKNTTKNQLESGVATPNDYLIAINAQDQAQQNLLLHQIQLLMSQYNLNYILGN